MTANHWMECDDLADEICKFSDNQPTFPLNEVHMVMWEKLESGHDFCPSEGCQRLQRVSVQYTLPQRKPQLATLKGFGDANKRAVASTSSATSPMSKMRGKDVIDVPSSSQTSSHSPGGCSSPEKTTPRRLKRGRTANKGSVTRCRSQSSTAATANNKSASPMPEVVVLEEEPVKGLSLGGKAAVLVPGLMRLNAKDPPSQRGSSEGEDQGMGRIGGSLKGSSSSSGATSSLTERVNDNLRKILAEKKNGGLVPYGSETGGESQSDRLQRMREKLQMARLQQQPGVGTGVKANLTETFMQGHSASKVLNKNATVKKKDRGPVFGHLSMPAVGTVDNTNTSKEVEDVQVPVPSRSLKVLHSPSHQRSSVKQMLRALKTKPGGASRDTGGQSFAGYCPKIKVGAQPGKKASPRGAQRTKKISFGQQVQVQTMTTERSVPSTKVQKRKGLNAAGYEQSGIGGRPAAKKILLSPKSTSASPRVNLERMEMAVQQEPSVSSRGVKFIKQVQSGHDQGQSADEQNPTVPVCPQSNSNSQQENTTLTKGLGTHEGASHTELRAQIPQLSPCSLRAGQVSNCQGNGRVIQAGQNSSSLGAAEHVFEDVIGELCATLNEPVATTQSPVYSVSPGGVQFDSQMHHKEHSVLDANLPAVNLDDSDHIIPLDFDPSLFGDSPVKHGVF